MGVQVGVGQWHSGLVEAGWHATTLEAFVNLLDEQQAAVASKALRLGKLLTFPTEKNLTASGQRPANKWAEKSKSWREKERGDGCRTATGKNYCSGKVCPAS